MDSPLNQNLMGGLGAMNTLFAFGLMGNIIGFITLLAPIPTFYHIYKRKSARGIESTPYAVSLMSSTLLLYYGSLKMDMLLISLHSFGCFILVAYVGVYLAYATRNRRLLTVKLLLGMNVLGFIAIFLSTTLVRHICSPKTQIQVLRWICMAFSIYRFTAQVGVMSKVIRTRNVHHLSFSTSALLTLGAFVSFCHGFLGNDFFITVFNILRFLLGIVQMRLYFSYRNSSAPIYWDAGSVGNDNSSEEISRSVPEEISISVQAVEVDGAETASVNISFELS